MSVAPTSAEEARELLADIKSRLSDLEKRFDARSKWLDSIEDRLEDYEEENEQLRERVEALEARLEVVEENSDGGREAKVREICDFALNARSGQRGVAVTAKEIVGCTGVSRRYAYDLIDELPDEHHFLLTLQQARDRQYGSAELDASSYNKALVVDCEALRSDPEAVNTFTTRASGEGAA